MSESFGWHTRRGFGYLASLRLLGLLISVLLLRLVGSVLSGTELAGFLLGIVLLAWSSMLGTAGFLPPLLRRMAQGEAAPALVRSMRPARRRAVVAGLCFLALALLLGSELLPTVAMALLHLLLPLHLAAAPDLLEGHTRSLARAEILARVLTLCAFAFLAWGGVQRAWPWLLCWWIGALAPSILVWLGLSPAMRFLFATVTEPPGEDAGTQGVLERPESLVALGDFLRSGWFAGIHPLLTAMVGSLGYLGFGAAFSLHRVGATLPSALATTVQGPLSHGDLGEQRRGLLRLLPGWIAFALIACLAGMALAPYLLEFLFPTLSASSRTEALDSLRLLMASWPAMFGAGLCLPFLLARGRELQVAWLSGLALLLCTALLMMLLPALGTIAAAWTLLATEGVVFMGSLYLVLSIQARQAEPESQAQR